MAKKNYSYGDGSAYGNMSRITPKLRSVLRTHGVSVPSMAWIHVKDYTIWVKARGGGYNRLSRPAAKVQKALAAYRSM